MPLADTTRPTSETLDFRIHPKLLLDVIQRQAGTLAKAILEGVMNGIDAKCKQVKITLTEGKVTIVDDTVILGSFNLSRSGEQNAENMVEIDDPALAELFADFIVSVRARYPQSSVPGRRNVRHQG